MGDRMTTDQAAAQTETGQSVNGQAPAGPAEMLEPDTGEKWLGVLVIAAGCFLLLVGIDRVTGGRITGALNVSE
jgi:hypothetical protein